MIGPTRVICRRRIRRRYAVPPTGRMAVYGIQLDFEQATTRLAAGAERERQVSRRQSLREDDRRQVYRLEGRLRLQHRPVEAAHRGSREELTSMGVATARLCSFGAGPATPARSQCQAIPTARRIAVSN